MAYKYIAEEWADREKSFVEDLNRQRMMQWRKQPVTMRIEHPTRLDKARKFGFKAKQGFCRSTHKSAQRRTYANCDRAQADDPNVWVSPNSSQEKAYA